MTMTQEEVKVNEEKQIIKKEWKFYIKIQYQIWKTFWMNSTEGL